MENDEKEVSSRTPTSASPNIGTVASPEGKLTTFVADDFVEKIKRSGKRKTGGGIFAILHCANEITSSTFPSSVGRIKKYSPVVGISRM